MPFVRRSPSFINVLISIVLIWYCTNSIENLGFFEDVIQTCDVVPSIFFVYVVISSMIIILMWFAMNTDAVDGDSYQIMNKIDRYVAIMFVGYACVMKEYYGHCPNEMRGLWAYAILFYEYRLHL